MDVSEQDLEQMANEESKQVDPTGGAGAQALPPDGTANNGGGAGGGRAPQGGDFDWADTSFFVPAQDWTAGILRYTVFITRNVPIPDGGTEKQRIPIVIGSDGGIFELIKEELAQRGLARHRDDLAPTDTGRWSADPEVPNSLYNVMNGQAHVNPFELYRLIRELFTCYVDFTDLRCYELLTVWTIGTYLFSLFPTYPILYLRGTKRSGKTRTIEICAELCFNGVLAASVSSATIFRSVEADRCTLLVDEAEKLEYRKGQSQDDDLVGILNSGYKRSGGVIRCVGEEFTPTFFSTYSPKAIANTRGLHSTTRDRTIPIEMLRSNRRMPSFNATRLQAEFKVLRACLYVLGLSHAAEIAQLEAEQVSFGLTDRDEELWSPMLVLARFIEKHRPADATESSVLDAILTLARETKEKRQDEDIEENLELRVLTYVCEFLNDAGHRLYVRGENGVPTRYFVAAKVLETMRESHKELEETKLNTISKILKKLQILRDKEDLKPMRVDTVTMAQSRQSSQKMCYRLARERVRDVAARYLAPETVQEFFGEDDPPPASPGAA